MICPERLRLLNLYSISVSELHVAATKLLNEDGSQFQKTLAVIDMKKTQCMEARQKLLKHRVKHGC